MLGLRAAAMDVRLGSVFAGRIGGRFWRDLAVAGSARRCRRIGGGAPVAWTLPWVAMWVHQSLSSLPGELAMRITV